MLVSGTAQSLRNFDHGQIDALVTIRNLLLSPNWTHSRPVQAEKSGTITRWLKSTPVCGRNLDKSEQLATQEHPL